MSTRIEWPVGRCCSNDCRTGCYAKFVIIIKFDNWLLWKNAASLLLYSEFWTLSKQYTYKLTHKQALTLNYLPNGIFSFSLSPHPRPSSAHTFHPFYPQLNAFLVWDTTLNSHKMLILIQFESLAQMIEHPDGTEMALPNANQNIGETPFTVIELADDRVACEQWNQFSPTQLNSKALLCSGGFYTCAQSVGWVFWPCICFGMKFKQCQTVSNSYPRFGVCVCECVSKIRLIFMCHIQKADNWCFRLCVKNLVAFASYVDVDDSRMSLCHFILTRAYQPNLYSVTALFGVNLLNCRTIWIKQKSTNARHCHTVMPWI